MIYLQLFITYLKIGFFNFGGGYAMLSLIEHEMVLKQQWISHAEFTDMVAISQVTPGPIGINMATYVVYTVTGNVWGSLLATLAVSLPSLVVMYSIVRFIQAFRQNKWISAAFEGIKPVTVGLIGSAAILLMNAENFSDYISLIIFGFSFMLSWVFKVHPILLIVLAGLTGLLVYCSVNTQNDPFGGTFAVHTTKSCHQINPISGIRMRR